MTEGAVWSPIDNFFPPEKQRVDAPAPSDPKHEFEVEDRRHTDWPRRRAIAVDTLLLAVVFYLLNGAMKGYIGAGLFTAALALTYFFICEATTGQTVGKRLMGLRVVMRDGRPAPANAVAGRTVLRLIDGLPALWIFGGLCMLLTGGRRQRLGDLATGTIVRRNDRSMARPPHSALLGIYPILWVGMALLIMWHFNLGSFHAPVEGRVSSNPYMRNVDGICQHRVDREAMLGSAATADQVVALRTAELGALDSLANPPASARHDVKVMQHAVRGFLHELGRDTSAATDASTSKELAAIKARLMRRTDRMAKQLKQLGLPHCAAGMTLKS